MIKSVVDYSNSESTQHGRDTAATAADDQRLILRCLRGEAEAWQALFEACQPALLLRIRSLLGAGGELADAVQEVAARVWLNVLADDGRLLRKFDPAKGARITTYFSLLAGKEVLQYLRAARRRLHRESRYARRNLHRLEQLPSAACEIDDFFTLLTPRERSFFRVNLLSGAGSSAKNEAACSLQNAWQLRHRIRRKFRDYFNV